MNRVYKVIWSKAKHCYVVTSEIARSVTKSASSARSAGRKGAAVLAMAALLFTAGGVLGEAANVTDVKPGSTADVIMVTIDDGKPTPITIDNVAHAKRAVKANKDSEGNVIKDTYAKKADVEKNLSDLDTEVKTVEAAVNNVVDTVGETFTDLYAKVQTNAQAVAAEETDRKEADKGSLRVNPDGVISKLSNDDGSNPDSVKTLVLNKDDKNQITLSGDGIKVGLNSGVMDKDGFYAGGDTADMAKAALKADGKIKGANGAFTVDENGNVASKATITGETVTDGKGASMSNGTVTGKTLTDGIATITNGSINTSGTVTGGTVASTGNISAVGEIHAGGDITGASASFIGDIHADGAIQGKSISDGMATMQNGNLTGVKNLSVETITTSGDLTVKGKLNMDEIDMNKNGIVGDNKVDASTKVAAGEITSYKKAISTKDGSEKESAIDYDEKGTSTWAKATDADGKWNKSTLTVEGKGIKSTATDGKNNASTNLSNKGFNTFASDGGKNKTYTKQTAESLTSQIGDDGKVKSVMNAEGISNNADGGTITNSAKDLVNTATGNMTNTVDNDLTTTVGGEMKTTVTGKVTEDYQDALETTVGTNETHYVKGNQTNTVDGTLEETVKGKVTEDYQDALETTVGKDETHYVKGNQTNTVDGTLEETVKGKVTEDYQDALETTVGKDETHYVKGNQTNTVDGTLEETVKENVTEDYQKDLSTTVGGNQTTTVTGDSSLSAKNITNTASEKITNQIGNGSAVKSEMTANGITNTAKDGTIYNKSKDILNEASGDIINWADGEIGNVATKITNITGDNTVISDTNSTTFENKEHSTAVKDGTVTKTTISGNTIETGQATMDYADVTKDLSVGGNATVENDLTVKGASEFVGRADFRYDVFMDGNLTVAKETRTDTLYVDHDGYVGGNLNVEGNIETHDAELSETSRQVVTGRQLYQTNERVDRLDNRIKKVGANAAALAALRPGDFNPDDKFSIAAGFGSYRNASAAALGLFYRPNENVLLSLGTSFGDGENMVNAGVSVKFGRGKSMAERRKEMADEVSSMRDEMRSQDERIAELEEMLKKQSELIEKLSKES